MVLGTLPSGCPKLPAGWNRVPIVKNAVLPLSRIDPERALICFPKIERPQNEKG
jgi:hypothetical protein